MDQDIEDAIRILLRTHISTGYMDIPFVRMGPIPDSYDSDPYAKAWLLLWERYGPGAAKE